jgi:hypothetical protein
MGATRGHKPVAPNGYSPTVHSWSEVWDISTLAAPSFIDRRFPARDRQRAGPWRRRAHDETSLTAQLELARTSPGARGRAERPHPEDQKLYDFNRAAELFT